MKKLIYFLNNSYRREQIAMHQIILFILFLGSVLFSQTMDYKSSDSVLNTEYKTILLQYSNDTIFTAKFKASQKSWIKYRDAELEARFPSTRIKTKTIEYGSVYSTCANQVLLELTNERILHLEKWIKGTVEGDVCNGSYQIR